MKMWHPALYTLKFELASKFDNERVYRIFDTYNLLPRRNYEYIVIIGGTVGTKPRLEHYEPHLRNSGDLNT